MVTFGLIGPGNLGEVILRKLCQFTTPIFYHHSCSRSEYLEKNGLGQAVNLHQLLTQADVIFITVKPTSAKHVCGMFRSILAGKSPIFISVMAGVPLEYLRNAIGTPQVARMMVDVSIGETHLSRQIFAYAHETLRSFLEDKCSGLGRIDWLDKESKIDSATAIFGCGPAFVARFFDAYQRIAVEAGFQPEDVLDLFDATIFMLSSDKNPRDIIQKVACRGGATEKGLQHLSNLDTTLRQCVGVAEDRCKELKKELLDELKK